MIAGKANMSYEDKEALVKAAGGPGKADVYNEKQEALVRP